MGDNWIHSLPTKTNSSNFCCLRLLGCLLILLFGPVLGRSSFLQGVSPFKYRSRGVQGSTKVFLSKDEVEFWNRTAITYLGWGHVEAVEVGVKVDVAGIGFMSWSPSQPNFGEVFVQKVQSASTWHFECHYTWAGNIWFMYINMLIRIGFTEQLWSRGFYWG